MKKVEESKNSADTSNVMYPGDVTIEYPPRINNAVNNSVVSEKSKDEMSLDEYKQWVMNQISQFPVSGWVRSTFSSGSIVIKEEGIIELVYIVLQSVVKPGITGFFKIDLHIKCYIYLS